MILLHAVRIGISTKASLKRKVASVCNSADAALSLAMEEDGSRSLHKRLRDEQDDDAEEEERIAGEGIIGKRMEAGGLIVVRRRR